MRAVSLLAESCHADRQMMSQLPEHVSETDIEDMFNFADKDKDGKIVWEEFLKMITPVKIQVIEMLLNHSLPGPHIRRRRNQD